MGHSNCLHLSSLRVFADITNAVFLHFSAALLGLTPVSALQTDRQTDRQTENTVDYHTVQYGDTQKSWQTDTQTD